MKKASTAAQITAGLTPTFTAYCRYFAASQGIAHSRLDREMARRDYNAAYAAPVLITTHYLPLTAMTLDDFRNNTRELPGDTELWVGVERGSEFYEERNLRLCPDEDYGTLGLVGRDTPDEVGPELEVSF